MYQPPASSTGPLAETATALQSTEGGVWLWVAVLGTCSVLLGAAAVLRRQTRSRAAEPTAAPRPPTPTPSILTDEERVLRLLESNGGRMRQTGIVERTDWSKSKVSMLLSQMEADGTLHKLRVGRENIISLPGAEPVAAQPAGEPEP